MQLTTNWQNVASYTFQPGSGFKATFYLDAKYSTQSKANNTTTVQTRLNCVVQSGSGGGNGYRFALSYANTREGSGYWTFEDETIMTGESTITHNADGTKTINLSASMRVNYTGLDASMNVNVDLPRIDRYPLITSAPDFSDEDDPTIIYTTVLGFEGATVEAGIFDSTGNTNYVPYRTVNVENGSYTFELTNEERTTLRNATPNSDTMNVMFKLRTTTTSSVEYFSTSVKQLRIVNADPTMTYTITETNQKVIDLLGTSANTIVENVSMLNFNVIPTTYKGSSVLRVLCGNRYDINNRISKYESPYSIDIPVKSENTFIVVVYDSRYNSVQDADIQKTMIEYQPVDITSFSFKRVNPTSANILVSLEATYYQKTFGSTANVPIVKWKLEDGSWNTIPSTEYTIDTTNNKLTITNYQLTNALDYRQAGQFYISIEDLLTTDQESGGNGKVLKGIPTFDAGEHDLKVNGDLYVADQDGNNKENVLDKIEDASLDIYSTTETIVGKWVNDKPIYRKVIRNLTTPSTANAWNTVASLSNVDELIRMDCWLFGDDGRKQQANFSQPSYEFAISFISGRIEMRPCADFWKNKNCWVIVEYTKSTD